MMQFNRVSKSSLACPLNGMGWCHFELHSVLLEQFGTHVRSRDGKSTPAKLHTTAMLLPRFMYENPMYIQTETAASRL